MFIEFKELIIKIHVQKSKLKPIYCKKKPQIK